MLTPLAVDPAHPFPYISGLSLNLAVIVRNPATGHTVFARVKVPPQLPRFVTASRNRFVPLEDVIAAHLAQLFKGMEILEHHVFRVTRNEDLEVDEDVTENLMQALERELLQAPVRPARTPGGRGDHPPEVLDLLVEELESPPHEIYRLPGPLDLTGLHAIADLDRGELKYRPFVPAEAVHAEDDLFTVLRERDVLLHHPYDSFTTSVQRFIEDAAADPNVLAIKQTLYRTSGDSPIVDALIDAAEAGKQVVVVVEIKARFDEQANISWARKLERAGCHVVYGVVGLKTHCKLALVVRQEPSGELRRYCHIGTGNYNPKTARLYEDFGLLTADPLVGEDVTDLFIHLTGYSNHSAYRRLLVAPHSLRGGLVARIEREIAHQGPDARRGSGSRPTRWWTSRLIDALYRASRAGVPVDLWVRGRLHAAAGHPRPVGDHPGHERPRPVPRALADLRVRRRTPARGVDRQRRPDAPQPGPPGGGPGQGDQPQHRAYLSDLIDLAMAETTSTWWLDADGTWARHHLGANGAPADLQHHLIATRRWRTVDD